MPAKPLDAEKKPQEFDEEAAAKEAVKRIDAAVDEQQKLLDWAESYWR